jgi:hypothetical protein
MRLPIPNPDVIHKTVADGAVLLSTKDEVYYGLNSVGTCIWEHLPPVLTELDDLCARVGKVCRTPTNHRATPRSDRRPARARALAAPPQVHDVVRLNRGLLSKLLG